MSDSLQPHNDTVHEILQARILEWVAFPFSRGSSQPRDQTQISHIAGGFFTSWATREASLPPKKKSICIEKNIFMGYLCQKPTVCGPWISLTPFSRIENLEGEK